MSYLALPRIGFQGSDAYTNPSTANNQNVVNLLDYDRVRLLNPPIPGPLSAMEPAEYRQWMMDLLQLEMPLNPGTSTDECPPQLDAELPGYWNYYGDHLTHFGQAKVNSLWLSGSAPVTRGADPLLGAQVVLNSVLIDLDPADTFSSIILSGSFKVVGQDAKGQPIDLIKGVDPTPGYTRWLNFNRPRGAGTFQFVVPNERLVFNTQVQSEALQTLQRLAAENAGIIVRYCLYNMGTDPAITTEYLYNQFQQHNYVSNPKVGMVLGSIGVWNGADMYSVPVGRLMYPPTSPYNRQSAAQDVLVQQPSPARPSVKSHGDVDRLWKTGAHTSSALQAAAPADDPCNPTPPPAIGPAAAVVDGARQVVMLDLLNTFPEVGSQNLSKADFGNVSLGLRYDEAGETRSVILGQVAYDRNVYETQAGVVEVSYAGQPAAPHVDQGLFFLQGDAQGSPTLLLEEIQTHQVETDDRCAYFNQGEPGVINLRAFWKGEPATDEVVVDLELWHDYNAPNEVLSADPLAITFPYFCFSQVAQDSADMAIPASITIPPGGKAQLPFDPRTPGCYKIRFIPPGARRQNIPAQGCDSDSPDFTIEFFANVRVLPADDYSGYADEQIDDWSFMFEHVFSYYAVLYPVMSKIIPWGPRDAPQDIEKVRQFAALIRQAVDESRLGSPLAMPITRELSPGKRKLIQRWCDLQLGRAANPTAASQERP